MSRHSIDRSKGKRLDQEQLMSSNGRRLYDIFWRWKYWKMNGRESWSCPEPSSLRGETPSPARKYRTHRSQHTIPFSSSSPPGEWLSLKTLRILPSIFSYPRHIYAEFFQAAASMTTVCAMNSTVAWSQMACLCLEHHRIRIETIEAREWEICKTFARILCLGQQAST